MGKVIIFYMKIDWGRFERNQDGGGGGETLWNFVVDYVKRQIKVKKPLIRF